MIDAFFGAHLIAGDFTQMRSNPLMDTLKWLVPHGIGRIGSRRMAATEAEKHCENLRKMYGAVIPPNSTVFDVGANVGNRVEPFLRCGAKVIAVDPQPDCIEYLQRCFGTRVTTVEAAIGEQEGYMPLHVSSNLDIVATLSKEFISNAGKSGRLGERHWSRTINVKVRTLDSLIHQYGEPSFIKIDVEGYELEALKGLSKPIAALSFEWTSSMPESALQCIDRVLALGMPYFQFNFGESAVFSHETSIDAVKARQLVSLLGEDQRLFGDIFVTRVPLYRT